jgi:UDP:flavonoid glycosyltransferase YjiC (YdhE family)
MPLPVYMDVHVPVGVTQGLRRKGIDAFTAQDDAADRMSDEELLQRATELGRVLLTQDADFLAIAARC